MYAVEFVLLVLFCMVSFSPYKEHVEESRKVDALMEEANPETKLFPVTTDVEPQKVLHGFSEKSKETQLCSREKFECSDLNLSLSLSSPVPGLIDLNKGTREVDNFLSLERSWSVSNEGKKELRRKIKLKELHNVAPRKGVNVGVKMCPEAIIEALPSPPRFKISWSAVASAENNPAFNRALARIRAGGGIKSHKRKLITAHRKINTLMGEASQETNLSPGNIGRYADNLLHIFSEKTEQTRLSYQEQLECSDLNLRLSLNGICANFKEKPLNQPSSVTRMVTLNKDTSELGNLLSLAGSGSMPTKGQQAQKAATKSIEAQIKVQDRLGKQRSRGDNVGEGNASQATSELPTSTPSKIASWAVAFGDNNPALLRSLARIKAKDGCMFRT